MFLDSPENFLHFYHKIIAICSEKAGEKVENMLNLGVCETLDF
jgi:hypothetical protein